MNWQQYFDNIAHAVALKSKDPSSKVGCVIVDSDNRIISQGYNGFVAGCDESKMTWDRPMKYALVIHAELNALIHARRDLRGAKAYVTHGPCENCLKHMLQAGIREVYYKDPGIMRDRSTPEQKEAIQRLIEATDAKVLNVDNHQSYVDELNPVEDIYLEYAPIENRFFLFTKQNVTIGAFFITEDEIIELKDKNDFKELIIRKANLEILSKKPNLKYNLIERAEMFL